LSSQTTLGKELDIGISAIAAAQPPAIQPPSVSRKQKN
jgi:hypothetical protein